MTPCDKPTLIANKKSPWWWYSWYTEEGRAQKSLAFLGLSQADYTREQAEKVLLQYLGMLSADPRPGAETLGWLKREMLRRLDAEQRRRSTIKEYRIAIDHAITALGADYPVTAVKKSDWLIIRQRLIDKGDSPYTVNKVGRHLRGVFTRLVDDEIIVKNPFSKFSRIEEPKKHTNYLSRTELRAFLAATVHGDHEDWGRIAQILALTGRRMTEILDLNRDGIDLVHGKLLVMNAKHRKQRKQWIPIPPDERFIYEGAGYIVSVRQNIAWFMEHTGSATPLRVCHPDTLSHWIKDRLREIGRGDLHAHDLRHTYITLMGETTELWKLQKLVDHSSITVTEQYFHRTANDTEGKGLDLGDNNR